MLQRLFEESREHISREVLKGVGYFMSQKYCLEL